MSLLDTASLIVTPNGYKEGKLYSVIPSDGSGDLSVTRATTATRVNSAGLVELVPYNLFNYSQNLANVGWATYAASGTITRTANYAAAPDGTTTATRIQNSGGNPIQWTYQNIALASNGVISMYVKRTGATNQTFRLFSNNGATFSSNFTATDTWQRFEFAVGSNSGALPFGITTDSSGTAADILVWGAQLVEGSTAKDYQKTETRLNIPRLDYSNGTCPSILVEPQRTNRLIYSEELVIGKAFAYTSGTFSVTQNTTDTLDPFGNNNAEKFTAVDQASNDSYTATSGSGNITLSVFAKKGTSNTIQIYHDNVILGGLFAATFNIETGAVVGTAGAVVGTSIKDFGNGWYRCSVTGPDNNAIGNIHNFTTYAGTSYLFGIQLEQGNYPTSYIPTTSASVTRNRDDISKNGITSLIGQTEGTCFVDFNYDNFNGQPNPILFSFRNTAWTNEVYAQILASGGIQVQTYLGGVQQSYLYYGGATNGHHKLAYAYKQNDFVLYVDGVQVATDTSGNVPATDDFCLGYFNTSFTPTANYNAAALWKTRLTNTQLAQLTSI